MAPSVLVVDDDPAIRLLLALLLEEAGYRVLLARDGAEALAQVAAQRPALMLLDLNLPRLSGWAVQRTLQAAAEPLPVVVMTAGQSAATEAARLGAAGHLAKPFDLDTVLALVQRLIADPPAAATASA